MLIIKFESSWRYLTKCVYLSSYWRHCPLLKGRLRSNQYHCTHTHIFSFLFCYNSYWSAYYIYLCFNKKRRMMMKEGSNTKESWTANSFMCIVSMYVAVVALHNQGWMLFFRKTIKLRYVSANNLFSPCMNTR